MVTLEWLVKSYLRQSSNQRLPYKLVDQLECVFIVFSIQTTIVLAETVLAESTILADKLSKQPTVLEEN